MARRRKSYISGHCASGARGGHDRCKWRVTDQVFCRCGCHDGLRARFDVNDAPEVDEETTEEVLTADDVQPDRLPAAG